MEFSLTILLWFLWPTVIGVLVYWYLTKDHSFWKKHGIVSVPAFPIAGSMYSLFTKPMQETEQKWARKYGPLYGHYEGTRPVLNVTDPEIIRAILVKDFPSFSSRRTFKSGDPLFDNMLSVLQGEDWKRVRSIITPTFTTGKLKRMLGIFKDCAKTVTSNFLAASKDGKSINAKVLYGAFTMDVIASSAFSTKLDSHNDPNNQFVKTARGIFSRNIPWRFIFVFLFPRLMEFFKIPIVPPKAIHFFRDVTLQIIQERQKTGKTRNDFLQLLLDTAKEVREEEDTEKETVTSNYETEEMSDIFKQYMAKKTLSFDELVAQCVIFFLVGYDTTASTLSFVSYNLAIETECQEKLIAEIDREITTEGGKLTYEAIQRMQYLDNVISETLRLYPPAIRLERVADEDYKLADTGFTVPKGMIVGFPVYAMHRDPENFPDPEKFDPERFSPEAKATRDPYVYLPFGAGPRNCIGMRFALIEIKVCLAYVLSNFRIRKCSETKVPLEFYFGQGLLQPKEILLKMEARNDRVLLE